MSAFNRCFAECCEKNSRNEDIEFSDMTLPNSDEPLLDHPTDNGNNDCEQNKLELKDNKNTSTWYTRKQLEEEYVCDYIVGSFKINRFESLFVSTFQEENIKKCIDFGCDVHKVSIYFTKISFC